MILQYTNKQNNGLKTPKWELEDNAFIQAKEQGNHNILGQKVSLNRSTKKLGNLTREYSGEFETASNWIAFLAISLESNKNQPNEAPNSIYLGSHFL